MFEDVHWAETALLDLLDHIARRPAGVAAAPDLHRPPGARGARIPTGPRSRAPSSFSSARSATRPSTGSSSTFSAAPCPADALAQIARGGRGQPALRRAARDDARRGGRAPAARTTPGSPPPTSPAGVALPASIEALLAARLDLLPNDELTRRRVGVGDRPHLREGAGRELTARRGRRRSTSASRRIEARRLVHRVGCDADRHLPLPAHPRARLGLQPAPEADALGPALPLRQLGRAGEPRARPRARVPGDRRLPPRAGAALPARAGTARRRGPGARPPRRRASRPGRAARVRARRHVGGLEPPPPHGRPAARKAPASGPSCFPTSARR